MTTQEFCPGIRVPKLMEIGLTEMATMSGTGVVIGLSRILRNVRVRGGDIRL